MHKTKFLPQFDLYPFFATPQLVHVQRVTKSAYATSFMSDYPSLIAWPLSKCINSFSKMKIKHFALLFENREKLW